MLRSKRLSTRGSKNSSALETFKEIRSGKSALDQLSLNEDDVYDLVSDERYNEIVEERRKKDDFVVDDDGLGYHDDGEEHLGIGEDVSEAKKRLQEMSKEGDSKLAKKARKLADEIASSSQRNSILKHVKTGLPSLPKGPVKDSAPKNILDIDALLNDAPIQRPAAQRSLSWQSKVANSYLLRQSIVRSSESNSSSFALKNYSQGEEVDYNVDYGGDMYGIDQSMSTDDYHNQHSADEIVVHRDEEYTLEKHSSVPVVSPSAPSQEAVPVVQKISLSKTTKTLKLDDGPLAGSHRNTDSTSFHSISTDYTDSMAGLTEIGSSNTLESSHTTMDFKSWLRKSTPVEGLGDAGEEYVDMYWLDACENNGIIYLFGKVPLQEPNSKSGQPVARFVSCCVVVHGLERNLFVLPKVMPNDSYDKDGKPCRMSMSEVYKEINSIMVPEIVPRMQGQSFRVKSVKRRYAFECGSVPRETLDYMKVVYSAKHGVPTQAQRQGGKTYEKIFGASSSCIELFLLKRKLMGPCWIRIKNPKSSSEVTSWCRIEVAVENPKFIVKVPQDEVTPIPLLTSMCLSMKTAVNPATHVHEIIALSALIHTKVDSEAETEVNFSAMRRFTYVRQLGLSCGSGYPSVFPHDVNSELKKFTASVGAKAESIQTMPNERAMISLFLSRLQQEDPDILSSHNLCGFEFDVLLARAVANKLPNWSLLGRKKRMKPPKNSYEKFIPSGRILCDTYRAAKEFLRETTYSLTHLAQSQLGVDRLEIDPIDVPKYFSDSRDIIKLCNHTFNDAILVQRLMLKLQVVPLTKQLTTLSGNLWSHTIRGARAERIEYLLLHEFHSMKFILPEPKEFEGKKSTVNRPNAAIEDENGEELEGKVGGMSRNKAKAAYAGGLVLEPKKGLYDTFILLLDFNSLYPSIIQEYNLCFTTVDWTKFMPELVKKTTASAEKPKSSKVSKKAKGKGKSTTPEPDATENVEIEEEEEGLADADDVEEESGGKLLPPIPDTSVEAGILPRVIKTLVERRKAVKALLKTAKDAATKQQYDIRQKALKLTANSMYGCLGFSFSRFYARPIAALITAMGREALQRTVDLATNQLGLDVIYGDTDSVMINTSLTDIAKVREIGNTVKREVNKLYKSLELDLDGIFKSMLLLKKKKYAAVVINELPDGTLAFEKEMKGLDLVRRDWCPISKEAGRYVVEQILSGKPREEIVFAIHEYLQDLATKIRSSQIDMAAFVVTKSLNKNPKDYPDCKGQAHLQVALQMVKANKPVNIGDHIPYVICVQGPEGAQATARAYHPDEVIRKNGELTLDYEWYISTQLLPPISRLCEPIEGTSPAIISEKLGLDASKFVKLAPADQLEDDWGFTPLCQLNDNERFKDCLTLKCVCASCKEETEVEGILAAVEKDGGVSALTCTHCGASYYGRSKASDCYCYLSNRVTLLVRDCIRKYYDCWLICDDHSCGRRTMQQSLRGLACTDDCHGRMVQEYSEATLHTQLKYLEALFDVPRVLSKKSLTEQQLSQSVSMEKTEILRLLREHMMNSVKGSAYNWIRPSLWKALFGSLVTSGAGK